MLLPMLLLGGASVFAYEQSVAAGDKLADQAVSELLPIADLSASLRQAELLAYGIIYAGTPDVAYQGNAARSTERSRRFSRKRARRGAQERRARARRVDGAKAALRTDRPLSRR